MIPKKILIVDDQRLFADGLKVVIESREPHFRVVDIAENGVQAVRMARQHLPDIILMDIRMPEMDGVEATRLIHEKHPEIKILMLTTFSDEEYVSKSLEQGAIGYLLKSRPAEELINSIRALVSGIIQIDPAVSERLFHGRIKRDRDDEGFRFRLATLSPRERQILRLMMDARRIVSIASELAIAEQTVRNHVSNIYFKLNIHDRLEIVNFVDPIREFLESESTDI